MKVLYLDGYFIELNQNNSYTVLVTQAYPAYVTFFVELHTQNQSHSIVKELNSIDQILYGYHEAKALFHNREP